MFATWPGALLRNWIGFAVVPSYFEQAADRLRGADLEHMVLSGRRREPCVEICRAAGDRGGGQSARVVEANRRCACRKRAAIAPVATNLNCTGAAVDRAARLDREVTHVDEAAARDEQRTRYDYVGAREVGLAAAGRVLATSRNDEVGVRSGDRAERERECDRHARNSRPLASTRACAFMRWGNVGQGRSHRRNRPDGRMAAWLVGRGAYQVRARSRLPRSGGVPTDFRRWRPSTGDA